MLILGPLYHLPDRDDRIQALREAQRVARAGAPVLAAGISRYATLMDLGSDGRLTAELESFVLDLHASGRFRGGVVGFTTAYLHRPNELAADLADAGLRDVEVYGIEGPAGPTLRALGMDCLNEHLDAAVRAARIVERDPALIAASGHLLAVADPSRRMNPVRRSRCARPARGTSSGVASADEVATAVPSEESVDPGSSKWAAPSLRGTQKLER